MECRKSSNQDLNYLTLSRFILWILSVSRNPTLTYLHLSRSLDILLCDLIALTPVLACFLPMTPTLAVASSFSSHRAYPSPNFLPPLFPWPLLNRGQQLLAFFSVYASPVRFFSTGSRIDSFSPPFFLPRNFNCRHSLWDSKNACDPMKKMYSIWSFSLTFPSVTLVCQLFSIAPLLTSPLLL